MNYPLVQSFHTSPPYFNINGEPSERIMKERVLILYSLKSMLKDFALFRQKNDRHVSLYWLWSLKHFIMQAISLSLGDRTFVWLTEWTEYTFEAATAKSEHRSSRNLCSVSHQGYQHFEGYFFQCSELPYML